jgi:hypothetical protein
MTLSFHNDPLLKAALVAEGEYHAAHNMLAHVGYGNDSLTKDEFRGCSIGCYAHGKHTGDRHQWGADFYGHPKRLWLCADAIYEGLARNGDDIEWHRKWVSTIPVGVEFSKLETVADKLILSATRYKAGLYGEPNNKHLLVLMGLYARKIAGDEPLKGEWDAFNATAATVTFDPRCVKTALSVLQTAYSVLCRSREAASASLYDLSAEIDRAARAMSEACTSKLRDEYFRLMAELETEKYK